MLPTTGPWHWLTAVHSESRRPALRWLPGLLLALLLALAAGYVSYQQQLAAVREESGFKLNLYRKVIQSELKRHTYLPLTLARDTQLRQFLQQPDDAAGAALNRQLEALSAGTDAHNIYVMDRNGTTVATSNWNQPFSFLGQNYGFRPYFQRALRGQPDAYFAIGATTGTPGLFLSQPVQQDGRILGVVAIKVSTRPLEQLWQQQGDEKVFLTDRHQIIFSSNEPAWIYRALQSPDPEQRRYLQATRKYGQQSILPLDTALPNDSPLLYLAVADQPARSYLHQQLPVQDTDWQMHILSQTSPARIAAIRSFLISLLVLALLALASYVLVKRRRTAMRLQQAHDLLEQRVEERTRALTLSNQQLQHEISQRQQAHEALRNAQAELIQASKLAALGQMSAGITHELNQPLTALRTFASSGEKLIERAHYQAASENFARIFTLTGRMGEIINHLKTFARKSEPRREPVALADCLQQALMVTRHQAEQGLVELQCPMPATHIRVMGDPVRLEQVFINLLCNAIQALEGQPDARICITTRQLDDWISIRLNDNGPGFESSTLESIFDPFFTTKAVGEGLGLGLSIVYGILMEHQGNIEARNNQGAEIELTLPALKE